MKKLFYPAIVPVVFLMSCTDQKLFDADPKPAEPTTSKEAVSYAEITGKYQLFDSVFFLQEHTLQQAQPSDHHPISRTIDITITPAQPAAYFEYNGHTYTENYATMNEYTTKDDYYEYQRARFVKDSVFFTYYKAGYTNEGNLTIIIRGYKLK